MCKGLVWHRSVLANGLRVLFFPKVSANTAQLAVAVKYGSNNEVESEAGVAHFLEHMLSGGSQERIEKSRSVESFGGSLNFYTDHEYTMSFADVLPESLPKAAGVLSELLFNSCFEEEKFVSEREIILHELSEERDDPSTVINELLLKTLFKHHAISRPIGGYPKTLKKLELSHLEAIHSAVYEPKNMILMLMGNLSNGQIQEVLKHFKDKSEQQKTPAAMVAVKQVYPQNMSKRVRRVSKEKRGLMQAYLNIGCQTVNTKSADAPKLDLISMILGGGTSSRLFIELREKRALTYDAAAVHIDGLDFGYINIGCAVKSVNVEKAQKLVFEELAKLRVEKVLEEELERNKKLMLKSILRGIDSPDSCQDILAYMEIQYSQENALVEYLERIKAVTTLDILNVAQKYLQEDNFVSVVLKPK
ncbi:MAG: insulinase family protein [Candidatus Bathyarchaeota archaeon]|uniref:M16 family metallopeptidase n=1 Tax=Candidatus Bathycorpusculum sp. TaxID=2994959 RepID=UPI0028220EEF|nr:insulinase family protein [Candidatus Termiticorpusculum sp.]MCL2257854.1 insulinase family protein [Candidatus Termiticorpusculum sp.]MCL2291895.1 insulinase family protein [Candidatus Termiticorpusculum sp.]